MQFIISLNSIDLTNFIRTNNYSIRQDLRRSASVVLECLIPGMIE